MKKLFYLSRRCPKNEHLRKIWLTIKLTVVIFFLAISQMMASEGYYNTDDQASFLAQTGQKQKTITGKVSDTSGAPLPGVSVVVKGTTVGVITDTNGNFSLSNVTEGATIVFSFVGLTTQEVAVGTKSDFKVVMSESTIGVDEVIVIGYGTTTKKDFTGSVAQVKMENSPIANQPSMNALEAMKGSVAGLDIGAVNTAGGTPSIQIRGQKSISGSNSPLIVLDGVIYMGSINQINPNDIASYDVLKDATSSAAYGSRSANGVIIITTK
jgi:TonB-dependent SusC/RagA subfamily outer membrane receptor